MVVQTTLVCKVGGPLQFFAVFHSQLTLVLRQSYSGLKCFVRFFVFQSNCGLKFLVEYLYHEISIEQDREAMTCHARLCRKKAADAANSEAANKSYVSSFCHRIRIVQDWNIRRRNRLTQLNNLFFKGTRQRFIQCIFLRIVNARSGVIPFCGEGLFGI